MLNLEAQKNLETIRRLSGEMFGGDCKIDTVEVIDSPYPEFELRMRLYETVEVGIYYDRSAVDIGIKQNGQYVLLEKFTENPVYRGMKAMNEQNLKYNFTILNEVAGQLARLEHAPRNV